MNLAELLPQAPSMTHLQLKEYALILSPALEAALAQIQAGLPGDRRHMAIPVPLADGTFMLRADLLTEVHPGGAYHLGFSAIPAELLPLVQVVPWVDALALLPQPSPPTTPGSALGEQREHDGVMWEWRRARWPDGTFRSDDPETPTDEAYEWGQL